MLKNKKYLYGAENISYVPAHGHYGKYMLHRISQFGDKDAIVHHETGDRMTFNELSQRIIDVALSLTKLGVKKGDVVGICSERNMDFLPIVLGVICSGATFTAADITCGKATILHRVNLSKPRIMFCSEDGYATHKEAFATVDSIEKFIVLSDNPQPGCILFKDFLTETCKLEDFDTAPVEGWSDFALILYSSGTTGLSKGIPKTHNSMSLYMDNYDNNKYSSRTIALNSREWYLSYGLIYSLYFLHDGTTVIWSTKTEVEDILEAIQKHKVKVLLLTPSSATEIVKYQGTEQFDLTSLEYILSSSTTMSKDIVDAVYKKFPNMKMVTQILGMSEAGLVCNDLLSPAGTKTGSVGVANAGFTLKIVDLKTRKPCGPNERGELCIKSPGLMKRYLGDAPYNYYDEEGFYLTGDVCYYDEDGYVFITDRIKDLIKFNSNTVAPAELEAVLLMHPDIKDAGVVGAPHLKYGEVPVGFVVLQPGASITEDEIVKYMDEQVPKRMRLEGGVKFVPHMPYGAGKKLDRKVLKQWVLQK